MFVGDSHLAVFAGDVVVDELHGTRPVEGDEGVDVVDGSDADATAKIAHAPRFKLEHADGIGFFDEVERFLVIERDGADVDPIAGSLGGVIDGVFNDGECFQSEKIHLQQSEVAEWIHGVLGDDFRLVAAASEGDDVGERFAADDDAGCVGGGIARKPFEGKAVVDHAADIVFGLVSLLEFRADFQRLVQGHARVERDHLRDAIALGVGQTEDAANIAHNHFGAKRAKGDDLGDLRLSVFFADVIDDFWPAVVTKIHVDIGRGLAFGIEKALKKQAVPERVDVRDFKQIRNETARGAAASWTNWDVMGARKMNEVPDYEEIAGEPLDLDDVQLMLEAADDGLFLCVLGRIDVDTIPAVKSLLAEAQEILVAGHALGSVVGGVAEFAELHDEITFLGDRYGVGNGFGDFAEKGMHFLGCFEVKLVAGVAHALFVGEYALGLEANENIVRFVVGVFDVVHIVGGDQGHVELSRPLDERFVDASLAFESVVLEFDIKVTRFENVAVFIERLPSLGELILFDLVGHLAFETRGKSD